MRLEIGDKIYEGNLLQSQRDLKNMQQICAASGVSFEVTDEDLELLKKLSPKIAGKTFPLPAPKLCPDERLRRRIAMANQLKLYQRICDATGKAVISNYSADKPMPVYDLAYWWSDKWDQMASGREYDFTRNFFDQFGDLMQKAPRPNLLRGAVYDENSDYTNYSGKNKNCYMIFDSDKSQDCMYSYSINSCRNVFDSYRVEDSELCYECVDSVNCYASAYLKNCQGCSDSFFLKNCIGCSDCIGCVNLRNKKYNIFNKAYGQVEYERLKEQLALQTGQGLTELKSRFAELEKQYPYRFMEGAFNEDVSGNYLNNCKNAHFCFDSRRLWDCRHMTQSFDDCRTCMDCTETGDQAELLYECSDLGYNSHSVLFSSHGVIDINNLLYSYHCFNVQSCFGCIGLHHKKYCILNKQYSQEEYEELVPRIIAHMESSGEWGEFFPVHVSPFAYNETQAHIQNFPLSKEEILERGWKWKEPEDRIPAVEKSIPGNMLPETVAEVPDDVLNWAILCAETGRPFLIQKPELEFYRQMKLPLPRYHFDVRHKSRYESRMPNRLYDRKCDQCGKQVESVYPTDFAGKVFCETCFLGAVE